MFFQAQQRKEWLSPKVSEHISSVYSTLFTYTLLFGLSALLGTSIDVMYHGHLSLGSTVIMFASIASLFYVSDDNVRLVSYLLPISMGTLCSPMIYVTYMVDPVLLNIAVISTLLIFGSMTWLSYHIQLTDMLYLSSTLLSLLNVSILIGLINIFVQSEIIYMTELYFSLCLFVFYVVYDTRLMIERAQERKELNNFEVIMDAMSLFLDFANIFIRILSLLQKSKQKKR